MCASGVSNGFQWNSARCQYVANSSVPVNDEVAPHDPAQAEPVALDRDVEEERRAEDVAGADERLRVAALGIPREVRRHVLGEEQHPDREPGCRCCAQQAPDDLFLRRSHDRPPWARRPTVNPLGRRVRVATIRRRSRGPDQGAAGHPAATRCRVSGAGRGGLLAAQVALPFRVDEPARADEPAGDVRPLLRAHVPPVEPIGRNHAAGGRHRARTRRPGGHQASVIGSPTGAPAARFHSRTAGSSPPDASQAPSGLKVSDRTRSSCPRRRVRSVRPPSAPTSHRAIVRSSLPVASVEPSGLSAIDPMSYGWAWTRRSGRAGSAAESTWIAPSMSPTNSHSPSAMMAVGIASRSTSRRSPVPRRTVTVPPPPPSTTRRPRPTRRPGAPPSRRPAARGWRRSAGVRHPCPTGRAPHPRPCPPPSPRDRFPAP